MNTSEVLGIGFNSKNRALEVRIQLKDSCPSFATDFLCEHKQVI